MPLTLFTGTSASSCARVVLERAAAAARAGGAPVVVVPRASYVPGVQEAVSRMVPLGVEVISAGQFVLRTWEAYGDGRRPTTPLAAEALMRAVVAKRAPASLVRAARTAGFARALVQRAERPRVPCGNAGEGAVEELLSAYDRSLEAHALIARADMIAALTDNPPALHGSLAFVGFDVLESDMTGLLGSLSDVNRVDLALTWDPALGAARVNDLAVRALESKGARRVPVDAERLGCETARIASSLFGGGQLSVPEHTVHLGEAAGPEAEAALVASRVAAAISRGKAPGRILIVLPSLRGVAHIRRALRAESVTHRIAGPVPLKETAFGRAYIAIARTALQGAAGAQRMADIRRLQGEVPQQAGSESCVRAYEALRRDADDLLVAVSGPAMGGPDHAFAAAAHRSVCALLDDAMESPVPVEPVSVVAALDRAVVQGDVSGEPEGVLVSDWQNVGVGDFDVVVVAGLTERETPLGWSREGAGEARAAVRANDADAVRMRFYALLSRACEELVLVRQRSDGNGHELQPSQLWHEVLDACQLGDGERARRATDTLDEGEIERYASAMTAGRRARRMRAGKASIARPHLDSVTDPSALSAIGASRTYSASEVESYIRCPQRWFWEWVVRPRDTPSELDARELGIRAHRLLSEFYRRAAHETRWGSGCRPCTPQTQSEAFRLFARVSQEEGEALPPPRSLPERLDAARAVRWARTVVEHDLSGAEWSIPEHVEAEFGFREVFEFAGASFKGRIDRIDSSEGTSVVTDYKSARDVAGWAGFERAGVVQAALYAAAAERLTAGAVAAFAYRSMSSGSLRGFWREDLLGKAPLGMPEADGIGERGLRELIARTEERAAAAIDGMRAGDIERRPAILGGCDYCPVRAVCEGAQ